MSKIRVSKTTAPKDETESPKISLGRIETINRNVEEGGWVNALPNLPGVKIKVRARHNSEYSKRHLELIASLNPENKDDPDIDTKIETILLVETILLDWNLELPCTQENAMAILSDPRYKVFRRGVIYASNIVATLGSANLDTDAKN